MIGSRELRLELDSLVGLYSCLFISFAVPMFVLVVFG